MKIMVKKNVRKEAQFLKLKNKMVIKHDSDKSSFVIFIQFPAEIDTQIITMVLHYCLCT